MAFPGAFLLDYLGRLWTLIRGRKDNPLIVYGRAQHSLGRRVLFTALVLVAWVLSLAWVIEWGHLNSRYLPGFYCASTAVGIPFAVVISLLLFASPLRSRENLQELSLTTLSRDEVAFGSVWHPVVLALLAFLPFYLTQGFLEVVRFSPSGGRHEAARDLVDLVGRMGLLPLLLAGSTGVAVRVWISHGHLPLIRVLFKLAGMFFLAVFMFYLILMLLMVTISNVFPGSAFFEILIWALALGSLAVVALFWLYQAGRFAGDRYFGPIDPETLAKKYWLAGDQLARTEKTLRRAGLKKLSQALKEQRKCDRLGLAAALTLLALGAIAGALSAPRPWLGALRGAFGYYADTAAVLVAVSVSVWLHARGRSDTTLPLVSGAVLDSAVRYLRRLWIPLTAISLLGPAADFFLESYSTEDWIALGFGIVPCLLFSGLLGLYALLLLLPRGPRRWLATACISGAVFLHFTAILSAQYDARSPVFFFGLHPRGEKLVLLVALGVVLFLALGADWIPQRLHERELRTIPRHALTTDPLTPDP